METDSNLLARNQPSTSSRHLSSMETDSNLVIPNQLSASADQETASSVKPLRSDLKPYVGQIRGLIPSLGVHELGRLLFTPLVLEVSSVYGKGDNGAPKKWQPLDRNKVQIIIDVVDYVYNLVTAPKSFVNWMVGQLCRETRKCRSAMQTSTSSFGLDEYANAASSSYGA